MTEMDRNTEFAHCLNCNAVITGHFCQQCGQKYKNHKESFGELVYEFFSDFTHWDSRFVKTLWPLLFKPGKLTSEYNNGKRHSQYHPIRLYIFSSFVYFFLVFSCNDDKPKRDWLAEERDSLKTTEQPIKSNGSDTIKPNISPAGNTVLFAQSDSSLQVTAAGIDILDSLLQQRTTSEKYLKWQDSLSENIRDGFLKRYVIQKSLDLYQEGQRDGDTLMQKFKSAFLHNIPKMMFFLLPVFALFLKLLFIRHKNFYYVDHAVLSLHFFSFVFLILVFNQFVADKIFENGFLSGVGIAWIFVYLFMAMRLIYRQGIGKTSIKYLLLIFCFAIAFIAAALINIIVSAAIQV